MPFFIIAISTPRHLLITARTLRELQRQGVHGEVVMQFQRIQDARAWAEKQHIVVVDEVVNRYTGMRDETRELIRISKLGDKNPNHKGLSEAHRRKISKTMSRLRKKEFHHMWNRRHRQDSKRKISEAMRRLPKRRWCLDTAGEEHLVFADTELPPGWTWGRRRGTAGIRYY